MRIYAQKLFYLNFNFASATETIEERTLRTSTRENVCGGFLLSTIEDSDQPAHIQRPGRISTQEISKFSYYTFKGANDNAADQTALKKSCILATRTLPDHIFM